MAAANTKHTKYKAKKTRKNAYAPARIDLFTGQLRRTRTSWTTQLQHPDNSHLGHEILFTQVRRQH